MNKYAYFIASYGKPEFIPTLDALNRVHAKYPIYIVIGRDDPKFDEYVAKYDNLLVFDKADFRPQIDCIGTYIKSDKICTYSRLAVDKFARDMGIRYVGYLFDDIKKFRLRYETKDHRISGLNDFPVDRVIDMYIMLLNASKDIYIVGPPQSSFYIGVNSDKVDKYTTRYGNFFIYDTEKELEPYRASILEDMSIVMYNNMMGKLSICPFGLQVECRDPAITKDSYGNMSRLEYYEHYAIIDGGHTVTSIPATIHYKDYIPKIISEQTIRKKKGLF